MSKNEKKRKMSLKKNTEEKQKVTKKKREKCHTMAYAPNILHKDIPTPKNAPRPTTSANCTVVSSMQSHSKARSTSRNFLPGETCIQTCGANQKMINNMLLTSHGKSHRRSHILVFE